jgi:FMN phosphatase YigB (HAD superfamily)
MDRFRPKYVTFDCHGTLINFQMADDICTARSALWT